MKILSQNSAEQIVSLTEVDREQTSELCVAEQLPSMVGILKIFKYHFSPTADFLLYHLLPSFMFSQGVIAHPSKLNFFLFKAAFEIVTAVPNCLAATTPLASLTVPH